MKWQRLQQVLKYGWKDSKEISLLAEVKKNRFIIYIDILKCFKKYYLFSSQYKKHEVWDMPVCVRNDKLHEIGKKNNERDTQINEQFTNRKFLSKFSSLKYQNTSKLIKKRLEAYTERYHFGKNCTVLYNVDISTQHCLKGSISVGNNVLFGKNCFIDYSGELIIHDNVSLANGVIIETHTHPLEESRKTPVPGRLVIGDGVSVLTRSYIADTCHYIGRYARIGAGTYVRSNIPPYAIVMGNPAKIIGFLYSPEEMVEFEKDKYPENERTSFEQYTHWYEKYFKNRKKEIKSFIKL